MITLSAKQYIESQNIRVFPCAYRGYYNADETLVFDPEARATTEANFTNTFHKLSDNKESYVIAWAQDSATDIDGTGTLKCVIGGYYFEIYNHRMSNFFYLDPKDASKLKPYYLCIKTESISLGTSEPDSTNARTTEVLSSFAESTNYLDVKDFMGRDEKMYMYELEKFKTFEEAQKEVDRLNNIHSNKKQAKQWNTRDKFILQSYLESKGEN